MKRLSFYDEIKRNKIKSYALATVFFFILFAIVYAISFFFSTGTAILMISIATILIIAHIWHSYNHGAEMVLKSVKAKPADPIKNRYYIDTVEGLAIAAGIPAPKAYVMESPEINAFAAGKDPEHAVICVTTGALEKLKRDELEGMIGHEMTHIMNYDIRFSTLVAALVGIIAVVSQIFIRSMWFRGGRSRDRGGAVVVVLLIIGVLLAILAPVATRIVQATVSRKREFAADAGGAKLTRYPEGLAKALEKIKKENTGKMKVSEGISHLFFTDPNTSPLDKLFATHPPLDERIKRLREM